MLASSLNYEATLTNVARLAVPRFADWCSIDIIEEDGSIGRLTVAHVDPEKVRWAQALAEKYPPRPERSLRGPRRHPRRPAGALLMRFPTNCSSTGRRPRRPSSTRSFEELGLK